MTSPIARILASKYTDVYMLINPIDDKKIWVPEIFVSKTNNNNSSVCKHKTSKTPGDCTLQLIQWQNENNHNYKRYSKILPTIVPKFDLNLMLICANPQCPGKISSDITKIDGNKVHSGCYFRFMEKEKKEFPTVHERDENNNTVIRKEFILPGCSKNCCRKVNTIVNNHNRILDKETKRLQNLHKCIEERDWENLPNMDNDNLTPESRTSNQIILDWFTVPENCNRYLGANNEITKNTSGTTREAVRVQVSNLIFEEIGKSVMIKYCFFNTATTSLYLHVVYSSVGVIQKTTKIEGMFGFIR